MTTDIESVVDGNELEKQIAYAEKMEQLGFDFGLVAGEAFIESMRNTYYRHTGTALDELIDNAIEAGANTVHVALGYHGKSEAKPDAIAIIDNGHGMVKEMIPLSVTWGGTHRENSRTGLGRFGFGLPSASVNQARRYTVFSRIRGGDWHAVTIDLDDIANGKYNKNGRVVVPQAEGKDLPKWVADYIQANFRERALEQGTIVLWEKVDRLDWITTSGLTRHLLEHFGVTFRSYLQRVGLFFDGKRVEPTDPLFITPGYRYYDLDEDRAEARPPAVVEVLAKSTGQKVPIQIRYAAFPPSFFKIDKSKKSAYGANANQRFQVAKTNAGIVICRMGRQIDVLERSPWEGFERFRNDDRYWGMEIDFPAELDEDFTISNAKQGVVIKDRIWNILRENGVFAALKQLRKDYVDARDVAAADEPSGDAQRLSEKAMADSDKFQPKRAETPNPVREEKAREALEQYAKQRARETKRPVAEVRDEIEKVAEHRPYQVEFESLPGAPFFRVQQVGGAKVLRINRDHRFFADVYASSESTPLVRAALETVLFSIGHCELDAGEDTDRGHFYRMERMAWSMRLSSALTSLNRYVAHGELSEDDSPESEAA